MSPATLRVLAFPAGRIVALVAALVGGVGVLAGAIRTAPLILSPGVSSTLAPVFARAVVGAACETALVVAPAVGFAAAGAGLVARGELAALAALGVRPLRLVAATWPVVAAVVLCATATALAWGGEAAAPGRFLRGLVERARVACPERGTSDVPLLGATWVCFEGEPPRLVSAPFADGAAAFSAAAIDLADDLGTLRLLDATLVVRARGTTPEIRVHAAETSVLGALPVLRASNLSAGLRALVVAATSAALALASLGAVLGARVRGRVGASAIGAAGPAASLLVFSALEREVSPTFAYASVPIAGLAAVAVAFAVARRLHAGGELER